MKRYKNLVELVLFHLSVGHQCRAKQLQHAQFGFKGVLHGEGSIGGGRLESGGDVARLPPAHHEEYRHGEAHAGANGQ